MNCLFLPLSPSLYVVIFFLNLNNDERTLVLIALNIEASTTKQINVTLLVFFLVIYYSCYSWVDSIRFDLIHSKHVCMSVMLYFKQFFYVLRVCIVFFGKCLEWAGSIYAVNMPVCSCSCTRVCLCNVYVYIDCEFHLIARQPL